MLIDIECEDCRFKFCVGSYFGGDGLVVVGVCLNCGLHVQGPQDTPVEVDQVQEAIDNGLFEDNPSLKRQLEARLKNQKLGLPAKLHVLAPRGLNSDNHSEADTEHPLEEWSEYKPSKDCPVCEAKDSLAFCLADIGEKCPICESEKIKQEGSWIS